jgi:hypothetical protein
VEFALVLPIILTLVVSVSEVGLILGRTNSLGFGSREGARVGSALALGNDEFCTPANEDPSNVDATLVSAVQRILKSPDSGIDPSKVQQIRIFKATSTGAETPGYVNIWTYKGPQGGPDVDPGAGTIKIDFGPDSQPWPACDRVNSGPNPDSIGVSIRYTYDFMTPLFSVIDAMAGGGLSLTLTETTVMSLNPTV